MIPEERKNQCYALIDSFMNAHINARKEITEPFMKWCNDYKKITDNYPPYRSAEIVFLRMQNIYDRFHNF